MSYFLTPFYYILPLLLGYAIKTPWVSRHQYWLDLFLSMVLYVILFITGVSISKIDNLSREMVAILEYAGLILLLTLVLNIFFSAVYDSYFSHKIKKEKVAYASRWLVLFHNVKPLAWIFIGIVAGLIYPNFFSHLDEIITLLLILMLLVIGLQLRASDIRLRDVLLNRRGVTLSLIFIFSCAIAAVFLAKLLGLPYSQLLAINSGYGWYSLSSGLMTKYFGPFWGAVALINDLGREIMAFVLIPMLMKFYPSAAVAVSGATSLDFTLPAIKKAGGMAIVPATISFGFITTIVSPFMMIFFANL